MFRCPFSNIFILFSSPLPTLIALFLFVHFIFFALFHNFFRYFLYTFSRCAHLRIALGYMVIDLKRLFCVQFVLFSIFFRFLFDFTHSIHFSTSERVCACADMSNVHIAQLCLLLFSKSNNLKLNASIAPPFIR